MAHPDLVKVWGRARPQPERDPRHYYEPAVEAMLEAGVAMEVSTAGLRKPVGELYPAPALLEMAVDAGLPIALSSDAHVPEQLGFRYDDAVAALRDAGVHRAVRVRGPASGGWSRSGLMVRTGLGIDTHAFARRPAADPRRRRHPARGGARRPLRRRRAHPRRDRRAARRRRAGRHRRSTSPTPTRASKDADSIELLRTVVAQLGEAGWAIGNVDATVVLERPKLAPHRDAIRATLAGALGLPLDAVNVKATTGERMGFVGRGEGAAAMAVATIDRA